ncbi:MAG: glutamine amidotransferase [Marmoricola sp.]
MLPFALLSIRSEREAAEDEHESFGRFSGLDSSGLRRIDLALGELPQLDLDDWSGVILGGGPWNASDPAVAKTEAQLRAESWLRSLLDEVVARDFPFLGACYGIGALGSHQGGLVDRQWPEPVGPLQVMLTDHGAADPVFAQLPASFAAYGGHKEGLSRLPPAAVLLATSTTCPVQAFRVGANVYATQFHPELDADGVCTRIEVYKEAGYFDPSTAEELKASARTVEVAHPMSVLAAFVERHRR